MGMPLNKNNADLTVVITTHNRVRLLRRCILSVLPQKYVKEIIIIDDNSTDATTRYITKLRKYYTIIHYKKNENNYGACYSRNAGIMEAKSRYITFIDDDDYVLPGRYDEMLALFRDNNYSFISSGRLADINYGSKIVPAPGQIFGEISISELSKNNHIDIGFIAEKNTLEKIGGFDLSLPCFHDWDIILRLIHNCGIGYKIKKFNYMVNERQDSSRITNHQTHKIGFQAIKNKHGEKFDEKSNIFLDCEIRYRSSGLTFSDLKFIFECLVTRSPRPAYLFFKKVFNR